MASSFQFFIVIPQQSRHAPAKYGGFLKPKDAPAKEVVDRHLWLGRALTAKEFNEEFPKAIKSLPIGYTQDIPLGIVVEVEKPEDEELKALKAKHAEEISLMQEGVNDFTAQCNAQIEELKRQLAEATARTGTPSEEPPAVETPAEAPTEDAAAAGTLGAEAEPQTAAAEKSAAAAPAPSPKAAKTASKAAKTASKADKATE